MKMRKKKKKKRKRKKNKKKSDSLFDSKTFVISGSFSKSQKEMKALIEDNGGEIKASMNKNIDYVIVGNDNPDLESTKCLSAKKK